MIRWQPHLEPSSPRPIIDRTRARWYEWVILGAGLAAAVLALLEATGRLP